MVYFSIIMMVYFSIIIYSHADGEQTLTVKYYSSTSKSLYQTSTTIPFARDTHYGTLDSPMTIEL